MTCIVYLYYVLLFFTMSLYKGFWLELHVKQRLQCTDTFSIPVSNLFSICSHWVHFMHIIYMYHNWVRYVVKYTFGPCILITLKAVFIVVFPCFRNLKGNSIYMNDLQCLFIISCKHTNWWVLISIIISEHFVKSFWFRGLCLLMLLDVIYTSGFKW